MSLEIVKETNFVCLPTGVCLKDSDNVRIVFLLYGILQIFHRDRGFVNDWSCLRTSLYQYTYVCIYQWCKITAISPKYSYMNYGQN